MTDDKKKEQWKEAKERWRYNQALKGLCLHCKEKVVRGRMCCEKHLNYHAEAAMRYKKKCIDEGKCITCGILLDPVERNETGQCCMTCSEIQADRARLRR